MKKAPTGSRPVSVNPPRERAVEVADKWLRRNDFKARQPVLHLVRIADFDFVNWRALLP